MSAIRTVVMIDDDPASADTAGYFLKQRGFDFHTAESGKQGLRLVEDTGPDIVVLDLSLPDMDGTSVCQRLRQWSNVPIIMLTGRDGVSDRLNGFSLGADDYILKPFSPLELTARVEAVLRRARPMPQESPHTVVVGELVIDLARHEVREGDRLVDLTPSELRILALLARAEGMVVTRDQILHELAGNSYERDYRTIDAHVSHLRRKLVTAGVSSVCIRAVYSRGYRLTVA